MIIASTIAWISALVIVLAAVIATALATARRMPALGLVGLLPVAVGAVLLVSGAVIPAPHRVAEVLLALAVAALGVTGGAPLSMFVLGLASSGGRADDGLHGGILVRADSAPGTPGAPGVLPGARKEVLRGGGIIGYLERFAIVAAVAVGHAEVIAAVIAIKGLGRFSELDTAEARERFIIGTLVSMIWGTLCGALIALGGL